MTTTVGPCLDFAAIQSLTTGALPTDARRWASHLSACPDCVKLVRGLKCDKPVLEGATRTLGDTDPVVNGLRLSFGLDSMFASSVVTLKSADNLTTPTKPTVRELPSEERCVGPYRILKQLGTGGFGVVYQAEDMQLKRMVALKLMRPEDLADPLSRQRFLREARAAASLEHENVVTVYQVGEVDNTPFIAMQILQGETLEARIRTEGRLSVVETLRIAQKVCAGLGAAHDRGLVHRDIKPANIFLESHSDRVKILDFGLARGAIDTQHLTQTGMVVGTPAFMSPEQARGGPIDLRTDLYSLGCVIFTMLAGEPPIVCPDPMAMLVALATDPPRPLTRFAPETPAPLVGLVNRLLVKHPDSRPASAHEVLAALDTITDLLPRFMPGVMTADWEAVAQAEESDQPPASGGRAMAVGLLAALFVLVAVGGIAYLVAPQSVQKFWHDMRQKKS